MADLNHVHKIREFTDNLDLIDFIEFDPSMINSEERIRKYCYENICGNYGKHHMCPPLIGSIEEIRKKLSHYDKAFLVRYSVDVDVTGDKKQVKRSKIDFHKKILELEKSFQREDVWGLVGGSCSFCIECKAVNNEPCKHPHKARPSLESLGVDVQKLLDNFGLDNNFYPDKIVWTGCILLKTRK